MHVVATVVTQSYSPGLFTGAAAWVPLGAYCLARAFRGLSRGDLAWGFAIGAVATALITVFALDPALLPLP